MARKQHTRPHANQAQRRKALIAAQRSKSGGGAPLPPEPGDESALDALEAANEQVHQARYSLSLAVEDARKNHHSWAQIAQALNCSPQAAHKRFKATLSDDASLDLRTSPYRSQ